MQEDAKNNVELFADIIKKDYIINPNIIHNSCLNSGISNLSSILVCLLYIEWYSNFRKYAHPLHVKEGIITEKVFPVFSKSFFWTCFGLVMYIWELMGVTEKLAFQM